MSPIQLPLVSLLAKVLLLASATLHPAIASAAPAACSAGVESAVAAETAPDVLPTLGSEGSARD